MSDGDANTERGMRGGHRGGHDFRPGRCWPPTKQARPALARTRAWGVLCLAAGLVALAPVAATGAASASQRGHLGVTTTVLQVPAGGRSWTRPSRTSPSIRTTRRACSPGRTSAFRSPSPGSPCGGPTTAPLGRARRCLAAAPTRQPAAAPIRSWRPAGTASCCTAPLPARLISPPGRPPCMSAPGSPPTDPRSCWTSRARPSAPTSSSSRRWRCGLTGPWMWSGTACATASRSSCTPGPPMAAPASLPRRSWSGCGRTPAARASSPAWPPPPAGGSPFAGRRRAPRTAATRGLPARSGPSAAGGGHSSRSCLETMTASTCQRRPSSASGCGWPPMCPARRRRGWWPSLVQATTLGGPSPSTAGRSRASGSAPRLPLRLPVRRNKPSSVTIFGMVAAGRRVVVAYIQPSADPSELNRVLISSL
jgi:hypothetical protein